jgi:prepilin-type N-terminal cleavage/methylation domain-containing protein/prepilin-type processing-associated H-X9-DG protein
MEENLIGRSSERSAARHAFTLVELLVVIGIIAVIIAVLLPSLAKARRAANTVACLSNLRSIGQALTIYVSESNGYLPGSGDTSGYGLIAKNPVGTLINPPGVSITNIPGNVIQTEDWIGPLAAIMGLSIPQTNGVARFVAYCNLPQFQCPSYNGALMTAYIPDATAQNAGVLPALSYCEALSFMVVPWANGHTDGSGWPGNLGAPTPPGTPPAGDGGPYFILPSGYFPKITKIGKSAAKIFVADGARYSLVYGTYGALPTYTLSTYPADTGGTTGTIFGDWGAFCGDSHAWDRTAEPANMAPAPGSGFRPNYDNRPLSFRHGSQQQFGPAGAYYLNAVFFDGHAETLDDNAAADPGLWLPSGTTITAACLASPGDPGSGDNETLVWDDVMERLGLSGSMTNPYVAP